jgi:hypothetical protein
MIDSSTASANTLEVSVNNNFLPDADTAKLLFLSFRFSQGFPDLQKEIFKYLHREHPEWKMRTDSKSAIIESLREKVQYVLKLQTHTRVDEANIASELENRLQQMTVIINSEKKIDESPICRTIFTLMLQQDRKYLCLSENNARPRLDPHADANTFVDAHFSHVCHFVIQGNPTGHPALDGMCTDLRGMLLFLLQRYKDKEEYLSALD